MTIVMKRKQSRGKERMRNERKDKKDTDSKSKSTTQKKRRRYTHKKKKAKLMKKRSIRKQRGGNPTKRQEEDAKLDKKTDTPGVTEMLSAAKKSAEDQQFKDGIPDSKATADALLSSVLGTTPSTILTSRASDARKAAEAEAEPTSPQPTLAEQRATREAAERNADAQKVTREAAARRKAARRKAAEADALGKARKAKARKAKARNTVAELKTEKPLTREETEKLLVNFNKDNINTSRRIKYPNLQNIYNNIQIKNYDSIEKIDFVINELLKTNIFSGAMIEDSPDNKIKKCYVDVSNQLIDKINIKKVLLDKTQQRIPNMSLNNKKGYNLIIQKVNIINDLIMKRKALKAEQAAAEEQAKRIQAQAEAEQAEAEAKQKEQNFVTNTVDRIQALKKDADDYIPYISSDIGELNNNKYITKDVYETLSSINAKVKKIAEIKTAAEKAKNNIIDSEYYTTIDVSTNNIIDNIEKTLTKAKTLQVKAIINVFILEDKRDDIINGNTPQGTPPDTPKEEKLSKIAEQEYIVIPDPANNINKDYFCENGFDGGIPAKAKNYEFYIIFLDGDDDYKGTEIKYRDTEKDEIITVDKDTIQEKNIIKDCISGDV